MGGQRFTRDLNPKRLRAVLATLFIALALPTAALIWQAYDQLKFEAFYQYRNQAEALGERIDSQLAANVAAAEARRFSDFSFLNVTGDSTANVLQRSPLAAFPVQADVPGTIGYFQVSADGEFSTPLLPDAGTSAEQVGISDNEYVLRRTLAQAIQQVLADNRLLRERPAPGSRIAVNSDPGDLPAGPTPSVISPPPEDATKEADAFREVGLDGNTNAVLDDISGAFSSASGEATPAATDDTAYSSQKAFDQLNQSAAPAAKASRTRVQNVPAENGLVKLRDYVKLDEDLQKKSEAFEQRRDEAEAEPARQLETTPAVGRTRRIEQVALPEAKALESAEEALQSVGRLNARITAFESEIDPLQFSLLGSGHLVLFRNVWRDDQRYIQGLLIDQGEFVASSIASAYRTTTLSDMSNLVVGFQDDVLSVVRGDQYRSYPLPERDLQGTLLHRASLSAPFDGLKLVFSINRLPAGAGGSVLAWTTLVIGIVFVAGFLAIYRLGLSQIRLARQQQDFVSAVSHELKTPLTSIRMYGEMLKEGWVDEKKRLQYYDFIHDESERLTRLISNVLRLANISRNEPQFDLQTQTVGEIMNQVESKISNQVERAGYSLNLLRDNRADSASIRIDADCFVQIVINLVDNAIKFSKSADHKSIDIGSSLDADGNVVFSVRDYGPGVAKDQMKKIFTLFYRTESELTRETVGTGIGLAIVHQLTVAMNGRVDVINREPGAEFRVILAPAG